MENGRHGNQDANSQWPNIQISSKYMKLCVYQIWCLYHKMNNMLAMPPHYTFLSNTFCYVSATNILTRCCLNIFNKLTTFMLYILMEKFNRCVFVAPQSSDFPRILMLNKSFYFCNYYVYYYKWGLELKCKISLC